jgi:diguanylate cyclase (GGDEF)-like protein/hemerythrin-like metal-binding protein
MQADRVEEGASAAREIDAVRVSRLLAGSEAMPLALLRGGRIVFANPALQAAFRSGPELVGIAAVELVAAADRAAFGRLLASAGPGPAPFIAQAVRRDGTVFAAELLLARETLDGEPVLCLFVVAGERCRSLERQLGTLAFTDTLTGIANRAALEDRLRDAVIEARATGAGLTVLMADLDGLKQVNDRFGHPAGDLVLRVSAQRFQRCIRADDTLARLGGDEFCLLLPGIDTQRDAEAVAARLVAAATEPIVGSGQQFQVGVSVGIAILPTHGTTTDALIAAADGALYTAKRQGRGRFAFASGSVSAALLSLPLISWSAEHDVGIALMDRQHRELAERLNDFAHSLRRGDDAALVADRLQTLIAATRHHFASEECLMAQHAYARAEAHAAVHARLLDEIGAFASGRDMQSLSLTMRFLQEWWLRHTDTEDRLLAAALAAAGVT